MHHDDDFMKSIPLFLRRTEGSATTVEAVPLAAAPAAAPAATPAATPAFTGEAVPLTPVTATDEPVVPRDDTDAPFQVTLPRGVIRQIRLRAAEGGTTNRAIVLRALRGAGLAVPEGADVDRRVLAAKQRRRA